MRIIRKHILLNGSIIVFINLHSLNFVSPSKFGYLLSRLGYVRFALYTHNQVYGASLSALNMVAVEFGYYLVYVDPILDAVFFRADLLTCAPPPNEVWQFVCLSLSEIVCGSMKLTARQIKYPIDFANHLPISPQNKRKEARTTWMEWSMSDIFTVFPSRKKWKKVACSQHSIFVHFL